MCHKIGQTVSTQKTIIQTDHPSPRYKPNLDGFVSHKPNCHVFARISSQRGPFDFFVLFVLKPLIEDTMLLHGCGFHHSRKLIILLFSFRFFLFFYTLNKQDLYDTHVTFQKSRMQVDINWYF